MKRHSWKDTGLLPDSGAWTAAERCTIEKCAHCGGERVPDRDFTSSYLYRFTSGRSERTPPDRWLGSSVPPKCVER